MLGKAATLNADVGDVLISGVIHDEHSGSTYWLDNAFTFDDVARTSCSAAGLDNQRAVTVKSTFLQNRNYLDFYYREAYTVVEMEAGPFCNAVYEIADADRYPSGEAVNFSKLPIDFGIIHYASGTRPTRRPAPWAPAALSYYGLDSTYASSVAIMRRIFSLEGCTTPGGLLGAPDLELERLYTCELGLETVPDWYGSLTGLRTLDLGHNALRALPDLSALTRLEILYIHDNALSAVPSLPSSLTYLNVSENPLPALPSLDLPNLIELRALELGLTSVPALRLPKLRELHLRTNALDRGPRDGAGPARAAPARPAREPPHLRPGLDRRAAAPGEARPALERGLRPARRAPRARVRGAH